VSDLENQLASQRTVLKTLQRQHGQLKGYSFSDTPIDFFDIARALDFVAVLLKKQGETEDAVKNGNSLHQKLHDTVRAQGEMMKLFLKDLNEQSQLKASHKFGSKSESSEEDALKPLHVDLCLNSAPVVSKDTETSSLSLLMLKKPTTDVKSVKQGNDTSLHVNGVELPRHQSADLPLAHRREKRSRTAPVRFQPQSTISLKKSRKIIKASPMVDSAEHHDLFSEDLYSEYKCECS